MTAKNGAPGGSFCVGGIVGWTRRKAHDSGLIWGVAGRPDGGSWAGVNGGVKCTVKRAGLEAEKSTQKRAHFVAGRGVKNGLKMGLE